MMGSVESSAQTSLKIFLFYQFGRVPIIPNGIRKEIGSGGNVLVQLERESSEDDPVLAPVALALATQHEPALAHRVLG